MQSKYFTPAFNSAIFDGPVRIYFAQFHESLALKIYFLIQQKFKAELLTIKEKTRNSGGNLLIMIYPTSETFGFSFEQIPSDFKQVCELWNHDFVIGVRGALEDPEIETLLDLVKITFDEWPEDSQVELELVSL